LAICAAERIATGGTGPIDPARWDARIGAIAAAGFGVLALAACDGPATGAALREGDIDGRRVLPGRVGRIDPPRGEAACAVFVILIETEKPVRPALRGGAAAS
jgi:hypothetical protein